MASTVAIICAKGTSKRIPRKNIRMFHGNPIMMYPIQTALTCGLFTHCFVSTDDDEIADIAMQYSAGILKRGEELCVDTVGPLDVARHHLMAGDFGQDVSHICVLYATAPMIDPLCLAAGMSLVTNPWMAYSVSVGIEPLHDAAQFFFCRPQALANKIPEFGPSTVMIPVPPETDIDINVESDWTKAESMYEMLHGAANDSG